MCVDAGKDVHALIKKHTGNLITRILNWELRYCRMYSPILQLVKKRQQYFSKNLMMHTVLRNLNPSSWLLLLTKSWSSWIKFPQATVVHVRSLLIKIMHRRKFIFLFPFRDFGLFVLESRTVFLAVLPLTLRNLINWLYFLFFQSAWKDMWAICQFIINLELYKYWKHEAPLPLISKLALINWEILR